MKKPENFIEIARSQNKINKIFRELKIEQYNLLMKYLHRFDKYLVPYKEYVKNEDLADFWNTVFKMSDHDRKFLPKEVHQEDWESAKYPLIKDFHFSITQDSQCTVKIAFYPNIFIHNKELVKNFCILNNLGFSNIIEWKKKTKCLLFDFFDSMNYDMFTFDRFFDIYHNAAKYYFLHVGYDFD
ncbi:hypothetical protein EDEG_02917 [Edhazardia aedis USNM 41457]|uniref:Uncharacterized protein n=1 Tax=Edhazardia aedis (strain USNM 41457) TaxID=1003232 RepID=J9DJA3_EDHAE|nr:hypothetical protein EDEG_02917 [Edhazardia aedis USNM 41457]|eukprot:EJW02685.1 hypothetical protein EDEG_02917 [Edhazardia aedis USNM 41457]